MIVIIIIIKQRPTRQWHRGEGVLERNQGFLEPCRAETNKGSNVAGGGFLEPIAPSFVALRGLPILPVCLRDVPLLQARQMGRGRGSSRCVVDSMYNMYICMCICTYVYMCVYIHVYTCVYIYIYIYMYLSLSIYIYIYIHIYIHTYICIYIYIYIYVYMYIHVYTYT